MAEIIGFDKLKRARLKKEENKSSSEEVEKQATQEGNQARVGTEKVTSLAGVKSQRLEDKIIAWKKKGLRSEEQKNSWNKFIGQKIDFDPAIRAESLPGLDLIGNSSRKDFPIMRFLKGKFLFFDPQFGGVFSGEPVSDPTNLGQCFFIVPENLLHHVFRGKEK